MRDDATGRVVRALAVVLAALVFVLDSFAQFEATIAIAYLAVIAMVAGVSGERQVVRATIACVALSLLSWVIAHAAAPTFANILRVIFASTAIGITGALLVHRRTLLAVRTELQASEAVLRAFMDSVPMILWRSDPHGKVDLLNDRYAKLVGHDWSPSLNARDWLGDFHPDDQPVMRELVDASLKRGDSFHVVARLRHADGRYRWMSLDGQPTLDEAGEVQWFYGGTTDIHEEVLAREALQQAQAALEASQAELENFADSVPQILWRLSHGRVDYLNRRYSELTGHPREEAIALQNWGDNYHPDDLQRAWTAFHEAEAQGEDQVRVEYRLRNPAGEYRWMRLSGRALRSAETGEVVRWYGGTVDAHDEVLAQERVRELLVTLEARVEERTAELMRTEARYASLFEVSNMTFAEMDFTATEPLLADLRARGVTDLRGCYAQHPQELRHVLSLVRTVRVNGALARLMGYPDVAELVANPPAQNAADGEEVQLQQLEMIWRGETHTEGHTVLVGKDGQRIPVFYTVTRMPDGIHLSSHLDLTERERTEGLRRAAQEELARANRVATVGAFSASIAHELNQPIASMVMDAQTGLRWLDREEPDIATTRRILERLTRTAQRVADIVRNTRQSITAAPRTPTPIDLCRLVAETRELLAGDLRRAGIGLAVTCPEQLPPVLGDFVELQQVLVNLINNAADAVRDRPGERRVMLLVQEADGGVRLSVTDTGPGIAHEMMDRLFEPFFTTKPTGIGMGLQICRAAVEAMGGTLTAGNEPDGGARFAFTLPAHAPVGAA